MVKSSPIEYSCNVAITWPCEHPTPPVDLDESSCDVASTWPCEHPTPPVDLEEVARILDEAMVLLEAAHLRAARIREKERLYQLLDEYLRAP